MLSDEAFATHNVVELKTKLPSISILDVKEFSSKEDFIEKVKGKNPEIKQLIEGGSEFSIVYSKKPNETNENGNKHCQIVARVGEEIRKVIKANRDKVFAELSSYRVVDRFYVKRCNRCQKFGHYEKDCNNPVCCGYCCSHDHKSSDCDVTGDDQESYKCVNCEEKGKDPTGHSSLWYKCPTYLEMHNKLKKAIPYYQKKTDQKYFVKCLM